MKRTIPSVAMLIVAACWTGSAAAQSTQASSPSEAKTDASAAGQAPKQDPAVEAPHDVLVHSSTVIGGYGGPDVRMTSMLAEPAMLVGAQASWLFDHEYLIGVAGYGLATRHGAPDSMRIDGYASTLGMVYGGIRFGAVATPHRLLHVTLAALVGPGSLSGISRVPTRAEFEVGYERRVGHTEMFLVMEPEVALEANVTTFMRVALGGSYRYVTAVEQPGLSSGNLSGPAASLALKFGVF